MNGNFLSDLCSALLATGSFAQTVSAPPHLYESGRADRGGLNWLPQVRAWTVPIGASAPQAAGVIHTDFEKGFIRAQTIAFDDYIQYKGEQGAKDAGKMRAEGKEYIVKDGDVLNFLFNV